MVGSIFQNGTEQSVLASPTREFLHKVRRLAMHAGIAVVGGMILGFLLLRIFHINAVGPRYFLILFFFDLPYSPAFWGSAFGLGFMVNRQRRDTMAYRLGPIAVLLIAIMILASVPGYEASSYEIGVSNHSFLRYIWGSLFSIDPNKCPGDGCLGKLLFTAPFLNCVAYSIGARLGIAWPVQS